jgi:transposase
MAIEIIPDPLHFLGPAGQLPIRSDDVVARHLAMLILGECSELPVAEVARKFDYSRQRYYQLLAAYSKSGSSALEPRPTGPKSNYRRTPEMVRRVIAQRFVDPDCSAEVIAQKIRQQQQFPISQRSVERIIADYGLQKKTLRP